MLARPDFVDVAAALLRAGGGELALHLRAHGRPGGPLFDVARRLAPVATGAWLVVNDRLDVALALACAAGASRGARLGAQLGVRSLPLDVARALAGSALRFGYSAHAPAEARAAAQAGADWLLLGTIYATTSHPGRPGAGPALVSETAAYLARSESGGTGEARWARPPIVAIGGITPERVPVLRAAGAGGVAVLSGVWSARDPIAALERYRAALASSVESRG